MEIDPKKSDVVRDVFRWRLEGMSMYGIAKRLNAAGILSAGFQSKKEGKSRPPGLWSKTTVLQMLRNGTYIGQHRCSEIIVPCPSIVDEQTFGAVQRMNEENRKRLVGWPSNRCLLRGFLWCAKCTRRCISNPGVKASGRPCPVYLCGNIEYKPYRRRCRAPRVPIVLIEEAAWKSIWSVLKNPALLLQLGQAYYDALEKPEGNMSEALEHELAQLQSKVATTQAMMQDNLIPYAKGADIGPVANTSDRSSRNWRRGR